MSIDALPGRLGGRATEDGAGRRPWSLPHYLALLALPILFLETWTIVAWLADGPSQITEFRSGDKGRAWWGARGFEAGVIVLSIWVITRLVRDCRRQGRILTFDVMFCLVCATLLWVNAGNNVFMPMFSISSEFVNLNDTCGHNPLIVNPDCGRFANPIIFLWGFEIFGLLACAMLLGTVARKLRERWPGLTKPQVFAIVCAGGCLLVIGEPLVLLPLHLWTFPGTPLSISVGGDAFRYPLFPEIFVFGLWIGIAASMRIFRDDKGRSFVERGLDRHGPKARAAVTMLAMYGLIQTSTWVISTAPMWVLGFNQREWPKDMPAHVQNGLCDSPGVTGTRYGPCPGSDGWRMPVRGDTGIPGDSP